MNSIQQLFSQDTNDLEKAQILKDIQQKGVTQPELDEVIRRLQELQNHNLHMPGAIDICGTGGSELPRINTSTLGAFILSALDVPVAKHGNRASSGRFGSFDFLEAIGINFDQAPEQLHYMFFKTNLAFCYAPLFHSSMKAFSEARKMADGPTLFNLIGPLLNPANTTTQLIGTSRTENLELIAQSCINMGKKKVMVVSGHDGLDEITLTGPTDIIETKDVSLRKYTITPEDFGLTAVELKDITADDPKEKIEICLNILNGTETGPHRDLVLINVAASLKLVEKVKTFEEGYQMALECIRSGKAQQQYEKYKKLSNSGNILTEIVGDTYATLRKETNKDVTTKKIPSFKEALLKPGFSIIAEVKKASPSHGIIEENFDPVVIAQKYEANGARAISVLCNQRYFQGDLKYLQQISESVSVPLLCKNFIISEQQIIDARNNGASAILLMASVLDSEQIETFLELTRSLGMDALVEVHTPEELQEILDNTSADIVGINNRDLTLMTIDLETTNKLIEQIPDKRKRDLVLVTESGIKKSLDLKNMSRHVDAVLVGSGIMKQPELVQQLTHAKTLVKICGIKNAEDFTHCEYEGVDFVGLNFVPGRHRCIDIPTAQAIKKAQQKTKLVGVFQNQTLEDVLCITKEVDLDFIQLSGNENLDYIKSCTLPVIKGIPLIDESSIETAKSFLPFVDYILFESKAPGKGEEGNTTLLKQVDFPYLLAGGLNIDNVESFKEKYKPLGFDVASGVETSGEKNKSLITNFIQKI